MQCWRWACWRCSRGNCLAHEVSIIRVFHVDGPRLASNAFALESGQVKPLAELHTFEADATLTWDMQHLDGSVLAEATG